MKIILAVDVETTGLDCKFHEITQIAAILLWPNGEEISRYTRYVMPDHPNRALSYRDDGKIFDCLSYAHISMDTLKKEGVDTDEMCHELVEWISGEVDTETVRWTDIILMGQNPQFDRGFLLAALENKCGEKWPFDYHLLSTDSMYYQWYFIKYGKAPWSVTQKNICKELDIDAGTAHNAVDDVETTVKIYRRLTNGK